MDIGIIPRGLRSGSQVADAGSPKVAVSEPPGGSGLAHSGTEAQGSDSPRVDSHPRVMREQLGASLGASRRLVPGSTPRGRHWSQWGRPSALGCFPIGDWRAHRAENANRRRGDPAPRGPWRRDSVVGAGRQRQCDSHTQAREEKGFSA